MIVTQRSAIIVFTHQYPVPYKFVDWSLDSLECIHFVDFKNVAITEHYSYLPTLSLLLVDCSTFFAKITKPTSNKLFALFSDEEICLIKETLRFIACSTRPLSCISLCFLVECIFQRTWTVLALYFCPFTIAEVGLASSWIANLVICSLWSTYLARCTQSMFVPLWFGMGASIEAIFPMKSWTTTRRTHSWGCVSWPLQSMCSVDWSRMFLLCCASEPDHGGHRVALAHILLLSWLDSRLPVQSIVAQLHHVVRLLVRRLCTGLHPRVGHCREGSLKVGQVWWHQIKFQPPFTFEHWKFCAKMAIWFGWLLVASHCMLVCLSLSFPFYYYSFGSSWNNNNNNKLMAMESWEFNSRSVVLTSGPLRYAMVAAKMVQTQNESWDKRSEEAVQTHQVCVRQLARVVYGA